VKQCKWARPCAHDGCDKECCWVDEIYHGHCYLVMNTPYCKREEVEL
jgi:hypothetical protein